MCVNLKTIVYFVNYKDFYVQLKIVSQKLKLKPLKINK